MQDFLPVTREDMKSRGWDELDFVYVTGDAYVDHPSFGSAIIGRLLESRGYRVGMIPQPDWRKKESIQVFGEPRLGFLVTAGNMDSMVNHYTVSKKHRSTDAYSPGGKMGLRPDRASVVYSNLIRQLVLLCQRINKSLQQRSTQFVISLTHRFRRNHHQPILLRRCTYYIICFFH